MVVFMSDSFGYEDIGYGWRIFNNEFSFFLRKKVESRWSIAIIDEDSIKKLIEGLNNGTIPIVGRIEWID